MRPYVKSLFNHVHRFEQEHLAKLEPGDAPEIEEALKTTTEANVFRKSLNLLAHLDLSLVKKNLVELMLNPKETDYRRVVAINILNDLADERDESFYLKAMSNPEVSIGAQLRIIQGLGKIGTKESLRLLEKKQEQAEFRQIASLSLLMVKARNQMKNDLSFDLRPIEPEKGAIREKMKSLNVAKRRLALKDTYGMELNELGHEIECGRSTLTIYIDKALNVEDKSRTQMAGLITSHSSLSSDALTKMIVLFDPKEKGLDQVLVFRKDGLLSYGGEVQKDGSFVLECTRKFGSDLARIHGNYEKGKIEFTGYEVSLKRVRPNSGEAIKFS